MLHSNTSSLQELSQADFVVEAVSENEALKKSIFTQLGKVCSLAVFFKLYDLSRYAKSHQHNNYTCFYIQITRPDAILASNTSSISITRIAAVTPQPHQVVRHASFLPPLPSAVPLLPGPTLASYTDISSELMPCEQQLHQRLFHSAMLRCMMSGCMKPSTASFGVRSSAALLSAGLCAAAQVGVHFMNPVPVMKLVELIRGIQTSDEVIFTDCSFTYHQISTPEQSCTKNLPLESMSCLCLVPHTNGSCWGCSAACQSVLLAVYYPPERGRLASLKEA